MGSLARSSISRIAIVGAGPSGISAAKYLLAEKTFEKIDIFEQRDEIGGVWNLTSNTFSRHTLVPQLDPNYDVERQSFPNLANGPDLGILEKDGMSRFETPMYETLETNIPKQLMQYANKPFVNELPLFPPYHSVLEYCKEYAKDVMPLIRYRCQVSEVFPIREESTREMSNCRWSVTIIDESTQSPSTYEYDAVVVASGHFSVPHVPAIRGIEIWASSYPGSVVHSKAFRHPATFTDKKVVVVGSSASGVDIGAQIGEFCKHPLLQSSRTPNMFQLPKSVLWKEDVPQIVEFLDPGQYTRSIRLADGRIEGDIDTILFATGYFYSFPFLKIEPPIITDGLRTRDVYQQVFHIKYPTLAFPVLPQKVIPFPMAENQAAVIARVWSGRLKLPSETEMRTWEKKMLEECGDAKAMHILNFPKDADYLNMLYDWATSATPRPGLEYDGMGLMGTRWDDKQRWMRSQFPAIKGAYVGRGKNRFSVGTIEELGFDYEKWKETQEVNEDAFSAELVKSTSGG